MRKESEIKILEQISKLTEKLLKANDGYIKEFVGPYLNIDTLGQIMNNIKHDFPPLFNTPIEKDINRRGELLKERHRFKQEMWEHERETRYGGIKHLLDTEKKLKMFKTYYNVILEYILLFDSNIIDDVEFKSRSRNLYPIADIVNMKMEKNIPLTQAERTFVKRMINNQTDLIDENSKQTT